MELLISALSIMTVCLTIIGLTMKGERAIIQERVESLRLSISDDIAKVTPELVRPFVDRIVRPCLARISSLFLKLIPMNIVVIAAKLEKAGGPRYLQVSEFIGLKFLSIVIFVVGGVAAASFLFSGGILKLVIILCCGVVGYALPEFILEQTIRRRHQAIRRSMADSIDLLVVMTEAGLGFDSALSRVAAKVPGPLSEEFQRVLQDMAIGRSRSESLKLMAERVGLPDITTFIAAIDQGEMLGTSIAYVLRVQAENLRSKRNMQARQDAAKLPVKMLFPLVFCIFPTIFIIILIPGAIEIFAALSNAGK